MERNAFSKFQYPSRPNANMDKRIEKAFLRSEFCDIVASHSFRRLRNISFLGAVDAWLKSTERQDISFSRYHHSLGVAFIAAQITEIDPDFPENEKMLFVLSALLHDLGHGPLSHSIEDLFISHFGIGHHQQTNDFIEGAEGNGEISFAIKRLGFHPKDITSILEGRSDLYLSRYMNGPFNVDTLDGIARTIQVAGGVERYNVQKQIRASIFSIEVENREEQLDCFWQAKHRSYKYLLYGGYGRLADEVAIEFTKERLCEIVPDDFRRTDSSWYRKFPGLKNRIESELKYAVLTRQPKIKSSRKREFSINHEVGLFCFADLGRRYRQEKGRWAPGFTGQLSMITNDWERENRRQLGLFDE